MQSCGPSSRDWSALRLDLSSHSQGGEGERGRGFKAYLCDIRTMLKVGYLYKTW